MRRKSWPWRPKWTWTCLVNYIFFCSWYKRPSPSRFQRLKRRRSDGGCDARSLSLSIDGISREWGKNAAHFYFGQYLAKMKSQNYFLAVREIEIDDVMMLSLWESHPYNIEHDGRRRRNATIDIRGAPDSKRESVSLCLTIIGRPRIDATSKRSSDSKDAVPKRRSSHQICPQSRHPRSKAWE